MDKSAPATAPLVLSVGQCSFDNMQLSSFLADRFRARVQTAGSLDEARESLRAAHYSLVLVNRVLADDGSSGLELIQAIRHDPETAEVPVMLVSNLPDAQEAAAKLGAAPGFGKSELHLNATVERLKQVLEA